MMLKPNFHDSRDIRIKNQRSRKIRRIFIESDPNYEIYRQTFP